MGQMLLDNKDLIKLIDSAKHEFNLDDILEIFERLKKSNNNILLYEDDTLNAIYTKLYEFRKYEEISIMSKMIDRLAKFTPIEEFEKINCEIEEANKYEGKNIKEILTQEKNFNFELPYMRYGVASEVYIRDINKGWKLFDLLCIFLNAKNSPQELINELKNLLNNIIFDDEIVKTIRSLNDGFDNRKSEIIYHLNSIEKEIPRIIDSGVYDYREIGKHLTVGCSPERERGKVSNSLIKRIDGKELNCELHTKMRRLSSNAPDRIYFCPRVPEDFPEKLRNKIFVLKISKHV